MCFLRLSEPKARSSARVDLESAMGSNSPKRTASTGTMTRIAEETPKIITTMVEWIKTRASKNFFTSIYPHNNVCFTFTGYIKVKGKGINLI